MEFGLECVCVFCVHMCVYVCMCMCVYVRVLLQMNTLILKCKYCSLVMQFMNMLYQEYIIYISIYML